MAAGVWSSSEACPGRGEVSGGEPVQLSRGFVEPLVQGTQTLTKRREKCIMQNPAGCCLPKGMMQAPIMSLLWKVGIWGFISTVKLISVSIQN